MEIGDGGQQIEAQTETLAAIAIALGENLEHFQATNRVFDRDPHLRDFPIARFLRVRQGMVLRLLLRQATIGMELADPLIAAIGHTHQLGIQRCPAGAKQSQILFLAFTKSGRDNQPGPLVGEELGFLGVTLLFAGVEAALFFFGRSHGHSVASIRMTSNTVSEGRSAFLPGR